MDNLCPYISQSGNRWWLIQSIDDGDDDDDDDDNDNYDDNDDEVEESILFSSLVCLPLFFSYSLFFYSSLS